MKSQAVHPQSLMAYLGKIPDHRRRQGRRYPLAGILAMLVLAAMNGQSSLRGMWLWARERREQLRDPLGFYTTQGMPGLTQVWKIVGKLEPGEFDDLVRLWVEREHQPRERAISVDGKTLRGSRRSDRAPLHVVEALGQELKLVLGQQPVADGDDIDAALRLLRELPLVGRTVTLDAGLLQRSVVREILDRGGDYVGVLKENHPEVKTAVDEWVRDELSPPRDHAATRRGHHRQGARTP
jgi:hypothetical protein